jgi:hypothetical protein
MDDDDDGVTPSSQTMPIPEHEFEVELLVSKGLACYGLEKARWPHASSYPLIILRDDGTDDIRSQCPLTCPEETDPSASMPIILYTKIDLES